MFELIEKFFGALATFSDGRRARKAMGLEKWCEYWEVEGAAFRAVLDARNAIWDEAIDRWTRQGMSIPQAFSIRDGGHYADMPMAEFHAA